MRSIDHETQSQDLLTAEQRDQYRSDGYLLLRRALPEEVVAAGRYVMEAWVRRQVAEWVIEKRLDPSFASLSFETGLLEAWEAARRPHYARSPRKPLVSPAMFQLLKHPSLVRVAQELLGSEAIVAHGVFNSRPKLPDQKFTDTPWHQDAQYYHQDDRMIHTLSCWFPLVPVDEESSCLAVSPWNRDTMERVFDIDPNVDETGFLGIKRSDSEKLESIPVAMEPGDVLLFHQLTPHRALSNRSKRIRWSLDFRYQARHEASPRALEQGFVARDPAHPEEETAYEQWESQWATAKW